MMIKAASSKTYNIILPNTNKALYEALKEASPQELKILNKGKDLKSILNTLLQQSAQDSTQDKTLLNLLKNNPTLKSLSNLTGGAKDLLSLLRNDKNTLPLEKTLASLLSDVKEISEKNLKSKMENSGVFLESKIKNLHDKPLVLKEMFSQDLKSVLLKAHDELSGSSHPNKQELLKQIDKLILQIDYHQLVSHLSNSSSLYVPYSWEALEDGSVSVKNSKDEKCFCDINLNLKEYGELRLRLGLFNKNQLNVNISSQSEELKTIIKENMPELKKQLLKAGITPKEIRFIDENKTTNAYDESLFEVNAGFEVKV